MPEGFSKKEKKRFLKKGEIFSLMKRKKLTTACSFCGKDRNEVREMLLGPPGINICNECVGVCVKTLYDKQGYFIMAGSGRRSGKRRGILYRRY